MSTNKDKVTCGSSIELLKTRQGYSLDGKIFITRQRIEEWYEHWNGLVYVAFSGGKDSEVAAHLVHIMYPDVPLVFVDTGLEYPEIKEFVKTYPDVIRLKPSMSFRRIIERYGYPVVSKEQSCAISRYRNTKDPVQKYRRLNGWPNGKKGMISKKWQFLIDAPFKISDVCCDIMKKRPLDKYAKETGRKAITGIMATESRQRKMHYLKYGCNAFDTKHPISRPMSHWNTRDVWEYIERYKMDYAKIYDMGEKRTGCAACMFGVHLEKGENRFQRMKRHHPKLWNAFINGMGLSEVLDYMNIEY